MSGDVYAWLATSWRPHDHPHDYLSCERCLREAAWVEQHQDCACVDHDWDRVDVGTPAVPELVWVCSECLRVQGPAYAGACAS